MVVVHAYNLCRREGVSRYIFHLETAVLNVGDICVDHVSILMVSTIAQNWKENTCAGPETTGFVIAPH